MTESVREIYIGTLSAFPVSAFPPADYIALGHLHRPQKVAEQDHIRYCGSPIPLSFDETSTEKQVVIVDFKNIDPKSVDLKTRAKPIIQELPIPRFRPLHCLKGSLTSIEEQINAIDTESEHAVWLEIEVTTDDYLSDLTLRVQELVADKPLEILRVRRKREAGASGLVREAKETLEELAVSDVFIRRLENETLDDDKIAALTEAFDEVLDSLQDSLNDASEPSDNQETVEPKKEVSL